MSDVVWNLGIDFSGGQNIGSGILFFEAFEKAIVTNGSATQFLMKDGLNVVIFHGAFVASNGMIQSGTITGFDVYYDTSQNHLVAASGYSINFDAFSQALVAYKANDELLMYHLILGPPMTVNGTEAADLSFVGFRRDAINGRGGDDGFLDLGGSDVFKGGDGSDTFEDDYPGFGGNPGADLIFGEGGDDNLIARGGDDFLSGGPGLDTLNGGDDSDTADYSEKADTVRVTLNGPTEATVLIGGIAEDKIRNIENVNGGLGNDRLVGDGLNNRLVGNAGRDHLSGKGGNDELNGGKGRDVLKGGADSDTFVFDVKPAGKNIDDVKKFKVLDDTIALDDAVFKKLDPGALKAKFFHIGDGAGDANDRVIYDDDTGGLFYDKDGTGGTAQKQIADLDAHLNLTHKDFLII